MSKIIAMYEEKDKELNISLYDFVDECYRKAIPIMVCHVTEEEYGNMKEQLKSGYLNERLPRITNEKERGYDKFRYVITYDVVENTLLISDYENPEKIGTYFLDSDGVHYDEEGHQVMDTNCLRYRDIRWDIKVYTTETYEDIISFYKSQLNPEYKIQEKTNELIKLIGKSCKTCNTECTGGLGDASCERWTHIIK